MKRLIIDVREPAEYAQSHVPGAINLPPDKLLSNDLGILAEMPRNTELILYCRSGSRSNTAMQILSMKGYTNLVNGINEQQVAARFGTSDPSAGSFGNSFQHA